MASGREEEGGGKDDADVFFAATVWGNGQTSIYIEVGGKGSTGKNGSLTGLKLEVMQYRAGSSLSRLIFLPLIDQLCEFILLSQMVRSQEQLSGMHHQKPQNSQQEIGASKAMG
ncbi:hypothetical protein L7F22_048163 [Adiantum nelumboides]|nr:hypothetical protein [Adiantum nelumboides]